MEERETTGIYSHLSRTVPERSGSKNIPSPPEAYIGVPHGKTKRGMEGWIVAHT